MPLLHLTTTPPVPDPAAAQEDLRRIMQLIRRIPRDPQDAAQEDLRGIVQLIRKISGSTPGPSPDLGGSQDPEQHDKFLVEK